MCPEEKMIPETELPEEELDLIEATDEDGNTVLLQAERYFFYNGEEYCVLTEFHDDCHCEECEHEEAEEEESIDAYIMRVAEKEEDGEQYEEFEMVEDDALYEKLIAIVEADFAEDEAIED